MLGYEILGYIGMAIYVGLTIYTVYTVFDAFKDD
jgi:hypothetical protein